MNYDIFLRYLQLLATKGYVTETSSGVALSDTGLRLRADLGAWLARLFGA